MLLEPGTRLTLRLRDGSSIQGRFVGRTLLDSTLYASRFAARSSASAPFVLGETLSVSLRDGRELNAPFAGYGELTLLLRGADGLLRVPFEFATGIRRASGDSIAPRALVRAFRADSLPSSEALAMGDTGPAWDPVVRVGTVLVPVEDIESAAVELPSESRVAGKDVVGIVVLSVIVTVVLFYLLVGMVVNDASKGCQPMPIDFPNFFAGVERTTRPFDRDRGCYVGDEVAVADPSPGTEDSPATTGLRSASSTPLALPP